MFVHRTRIMRPGTIPTTLAMAGLATGQALRRGLLAQVVVLVEAANTDHMQACRLSLRAAAVLVYQPARLQPLQQRPTLMQSPTQTRLRPTTVGLPAGLPLSALAVLATATVTAVMVPMALTP